MHPLVLVIWQLLAGVFIPESLSVVKNRKKALSPKLFERVSIRRNVLQPGDLIAVRTPGTIYRLFRQAAGHTVDHLGIVMEDGMFLHVGPPTIRLLPVELLLSDNRKPQVFRPKLSDAEREQLLTSLRSTIGAKYNTVRVFSFIFRLAMKTYFGISNPLSPSPVVYHPPNTHPFLQQITGRDENGVICTDAILPRLLAVSKDFRENVGKLRLDANALKSWSINDVLRINHVQPHLLQKIRLPALPALPLSPRNKSGSASKSDPDHDTHGPSPSQILFSSFSSLSSLLQNAAATGIQAATPALRTFITLTGYTRHTLPPPLFWLCQFLVWYLLLRMAKRVGYRYLVPWPVKVLHRASKKIRLRSKL